MSTGFNVAGHGDLSIIFKANYSGTYQDVVNYTASNNKDLSQIFEPVTTNASKIPYATNYISTAYGDLQNAFMDINYTSVVVTGATTTGVVGNYTYCVFSSASGTVEVVAPSPQGFAINYVLVGGGGGGGGGSSSGDVNNYGGCGGGGGAGGLTLSSINVTTTTTFIVSAPGKAEGGSAGGSSTFGTANSSGGDFGRTSTNGAGAGGGGNGAGNIGLYTGNGGGGGFGQQANTGTTYPGVQGGDMGFYNAVVGPLTIFSDGSSTAYISINGVIYNICGGGGGGSSSGNPGSGGGTGAGGEGGFVEASGNGFDGGYGGGGGGGAGQNPLIISAQNGGRGGPGLIIVWWITSA